MAYRRRRRYNNYNKKVCKPNKFGYFDMYRKVERDVQKLKGLINVEFKSADTVASSTITTTPLVNLLTGLTKGDDFDNRDGRQV